MSAQHNHITAAPSGAPPAHARVIIIGGGIMGCGMAYHLAHLGWRDVVLLEKSELTSGSTWHAAGQITYATASHGLAKCVRYNMDLYNRLEAETGQSPTWHGCGSLRMAYDEDDMDWLRQIISVGRGVGLPMKIITPARIAELHPFYQLDGIVGALHTPMDGHLDPAGATLALAKGARQLGATIIRRCRATHIRQTSGGEWRITADNNGEECEMTCEHVVNAGGMYARQIALWNDYDLPAVSMTHHYVVTDKVPEFAVLAKELPVVRDDRSISGYLRMEQKSALIGIYEKENPHATWLDGAPWEAENELFEPHYERIMPWLQSAMERMPVLASLGIKRVVHGAISHPPDGNPLIGPAPRLRNYWCCAGCQIGIGWGPGLTQQLARWIVHGAPDYAMREFDPRRYGDFATRDYQIIKAKEDYTLRHEIPFPHFNRPAARPRKKSPLYTTLKNCGAVFEEVYGWERPRWFAADVEKAKDIYSFRRCALHDIIGGEVAAVRARAGVTDISAFAKITVSGSDAEAFINRLIANAAPKCGRVTLTHLLSPNGRIEMETTVMRLSENVFYFVGAAFFEQLLVDYLMFARRADEDINIQNYSDDWGAVALNGPRSRDILSSCTDTPLDNAAFPWLHTRSITVGGGRLYACRLSYCGELGWELHGENTAIVAAYDALWRAGEQHGLINYGSFAMNSMRMEKAFCGAGELNNEVNLYEANAMRFVRMQKAEFIGKEAMLQMADKPLRWQCAYLQIEDNGGDDGGDGNGGEAVLADGAVIGVLSSVAFGHATRKLLAFAYLPPQFAKPQTPLQVMILGDLRNAIVLDAPVYDPQNKLPKDE